MQIKKIHKKKKLLLLLSYVVNQVSKPLILYSVSIPFSYHEFCSFYDKASSVATLLTCISGESQF